MTRNETDLDAFARLLGDLSQRTGASTGVLLRRMAPARAELVRRCAIPRRIDPAMLRAMDQTLSPDEAAAQLEDLSRLSFVARTADACVLHDEARSYLLEEWSAPERLPGFRTINLRLREHFSGLLGEAQPPPPGARIDFCLHAVGADPHEGFQVLLETLDRARKQHASEERQSLVRAVSDFAGVLSDAQRPWLSYHEALLALDDRQWERADRLLGEIIEAPAATPELYVWSRLRLGEAGYQRRNWPDAERHLEAVIAFAETAAEPLAPLLHRASIILSNVYRSTDRYREAEVLLERSIAIASEPSLLALSYNAFGNLHRLRGDAPPAVVAYRRAIACLDEAGDEFRKAQVYNNLGLAFADVSDWPHALEHLELSLAIEERAGDSLGQAQVLANMSRIYWAMHEDRRGIEVAERAIALMLGVHARFEAGEVELTLARRARRLSRKDEARALYAQAAALFEAAAASAEAADTLQEQRLLDSPPRSYWVLKTATAVSITMVLLLAIVIVGLLILAGRGSGWVPFFVAGGVVLPDGYYGNFQIPPTRLPSATTFMSRRKAVESKSGYAQRTQTGTCSPG